MKHFTPAADCDFDWWKDFTKRVLIAAIKGQEDPSIQKEWIMQAYQDGHFTAEEAEDYIVFWGLITS